MNSNNNLHHYADCGLDNVWLAGGFEELDSPYGKSVSITNVDGLHHCLAMWLVQKPGTLTGAEFRFLRMELDLSQFAMGALCGREERQVRNWEKEDEVGDPANTIIRVIYRERYDKSATYEGMSKMIAELQTMDKELFEMKLMATPTDDGWMCDLQDAA